MKKRVVALLCFWFIVVCAIAQTRFALLTDIHVVPGNNNEKFLEQVVDEINQSDLPFVVITGDLTNEGSDEQLYNVKRIFDGLKKPYYIIPGNHEMNWSQSAGKTFNDIWGSDRFCFKRDGMLFLGFNCGPYMKMGDGNVKREDILWLERTLKEQAGNKPVIVLAHYPFTPDLGNWDEVVNILKDYNVVSAFCGHGHRYIHSKYGELINGVMCRALDMRKDNFGGYSIITVKNDSVMVHEKPYGQPAVEKYKFAAGHRVISAPVGTGTETKNDEHAELFFFDNASVFTGVAVDKNNIYFGNSMGEAKAVSKKDKKELWSVKTGASLHSVPVAVKNEVIVPATDGRIMALDSRTGKIIWENPAVGPFVANGIKEGNYLYQGGYKKFSKIDVRNGKTIWSYDSIGNYCQARPVIAGDRILFGAWDTHLYCLDKNTGRLLWKWDNGKNANMLSPGNCVPAVYQDKVIVVAPDRYMTAVSLTDGHEIWRSNKYKVRESMGQSKSGNIIYAKLMDGELLAVSADGDTYNDLWVEDTGIGYEHSPCPLLEYNGIIYLSSRMGDLVAVDSLTHRILWKKKCGYSAFNSFTVDGNGDIYASMIEGKIWRIPAKK
ncbi:MAG: PQQ-binding-like beta-propeller repeat protein [Barnesiella sp.]